MSESNVVPIDFHAEQLNANVAEIEKLLELVRSNRVAALALKYIDTDMGQGGFLIIPFDGNIAHAQRMMLIGHLTEMTHHLCAVEEE